MKTSVISVCALMLAWMQGASGADGQAASSGMTVERPAFTRKPAAAKIGDQTVIRFAVDRETDVAVFIEDAGGRIVRHLAAGVLGTNAPAPLKANALDQAIVWDGQDDDARPVKGGPFQARVGLGLQAAWGGVAFSEPGHSGPNMLEGLVTGMAVGPDGRVYVGQPHQYMFHGAVMKTLVFRRDGAYERTLMPFPPHLPMERLQATGAFINSFGAVNPRQGPYVQRELWFYPVKKVMFQTPAVMPDGRIYMAGVGDKGAGVLTVIDTEGGVPAAEEFAGPALGVNWLDTPFLLPATDGKSIYAARCGPAKAKVSHAIYRIRVPARGPSEPFFGDPDQAGDDQKHLSDPRAMARDGQGQMLIADSGNNRVVVLKEADASFVGALPVEGPVWVGVHQKTGAVYVYGKAGRVIKFASWKDSKEQASLAVPSIKDPLFGRTAPALALDALAEPAVLWVGLGNYPKGESLLRCVDEGGKFSDPAQAGYHPVQRLFGVTMPPTRTDPTHRMVLHQNGDGIRILDEASGQVRSIKGPATKRMCRLDRDGNLYGATNAEPLRRFDRDGNPLPFAATAGDPILKGDLPSGHRGNSSWERDFWVDRKGDIYVNRTGAAYHGSQTLEVYDQQGNLKRVALPSVTDGMYGPRVDAKGNIVILDVVKPVEQSYPREFSKVDPIMYDWFYGSVIKFGPQGGAIWVQNDASSPVDFENWRAKNRIVDLRAARGSLAGKIATGAGDALFGNVPGRPGTTVDADKQKAVIIRLKNGTDGAKAILFAYQNGRYEIGGPVAVSKSIDIKPNSDFTEYTFDMSAEKEWKGLLPYLAFSPSNTKGEGPFAVDWIKIGSGENQKVWNFDAEDAADKRLPADMKNEKVRGYARGDAFLQGALWHRQGFSAISVQGGAGGCHCNGTDFDMDDFGRIFAPDSLRFRVGVLDANGNEILSFGAYGNQDFCGPESYVVDPVTQFLRPRKSDDPKELVSPFAKPEIAFSWITGVAVTERHAYVSDNMNKRTLRVKLDYAAAETCEIK